ncbi:MAG: thermonuclease family protein [Pseudomonadota bacterium]
MRIVVILSILSIAACGNRAQIPMPENLCEQAGARCVSAPVRDVLAVDGDTFELQRLTDRGAERVRLRLIGWDSPETGSSAGCPDEDALGQQVETRARALFSQAQTLTFKPEGVDRFGRTRAHVYLDGVHVGWLLAQDGLSKPWPSETVKPTWCGSD